MSRNLIYLCMCTHLVRLPNQPDKFICQPCIQRQNMFQTMDLVILVNLVILVYLVIGIPWYSIVLSCIDIIKVILNEI